ncbi:glycoside hydrolase family 127 protein [Nesterenkonia alba]|uniref:glycoside hydrolase family 127 protein n=1 Tax=Nesterenkonia alba TaxID=515814 RepID=UPI0003B75B54|nr:beta-L-arabinofuranosidase domain-containing protein [Nesterenkonia alba]
MTISPVQPRAGRFRPLGIEEVTLEGGFWGQRQELTHSAVIPHVEHWIEKTGWAANFDRAAAGTLPAGRSGREFSDSEVYKLLEGMAWEIGRTGDQHLEARFQALSARVAAAQESDGYLNTMFGRPGQQPRYSDLEWGHELYCFGHLIQAGVARARCYGEDLLVRTAVAAAEHVCREFGAPDDPRICGHPEIETALAELSRVTGDTKYLRQAQQFIERRGRGALGKIFFGQEYFQDDTPVRTATTLRGHAVRALYLSSGAADVAIDTGDDELLTAVSNQLTSALARRTYLTGGMGAHHEGEAFGGDFVLPPDRSYSETCAGIASVQLNHRLLLATGDPVHADAIERTLYNVIAAAVAQDGRSFFYTNTLYQRVAGDSPDQEEPSPRAASSVRAAWFDVSCCPTNLTRTLASLGAYVATADDDGLQVHQYMPGTVETTLAGGRRVTLRIETDYPYAGSVRIHVVQAPEDWRLSLRVPAWAQGTRIWWGSHEPVSADPGSFHIPGTGESQTGLAAGDTVTVELPVAPRWTWADPRVDAVRTHVAVECGPVVMALESTDLPAEMVRQGVSDVSGVRADPRYPLRGEGKTVYVPVRAHRDTDRAWPYAPTATPEPGESDDVLFIPLIPYHRWGNRGPATMRVWLPEVPAASAQLRQRHTEASP